jgi:hypothetical protein
VVRSAYGKSTVVRLGKTGAAVVVIHSERADEEVILECGFGEGEVLQVHVEFRIAVHVEDALIGSSSHGRYVVAARAKVRFGAVEAALRGGEGKVADQAMRDAVGFKPRDSGVLRLRLLTLDELEPAQAERLVLAREVVAREPLLQEGGRGVRVVGIRGVIGVSQAELTLRCDRGYGVGRKVEIRRRRQFELPIPLLDVLRHADAHQRLGESIGLGRWRGRVPLRRIDSRTVENRDRDGQVGGAFLGCGLAIAELGRGYARANE